MIRNPQAPVLNNPMLLDKAFAEVGLMLEENLPWLTTSYGKVQVIEEDLYSFPGLYVGSAQKKDYLNLLPDEHLGNYCFFFVPDGQPVENLVTRNTKLTVDFICSFFFDYRTIYPNQEEFYSIENVKVDILNAFRGTLASSSIEITDILEQPDNVFQGFTHDQVRRQFLKRPYGILGFEGSLIYSNHCYTKQISPNCGIEIKGTYDSYEHASTIGGVQADEYFSLSKTNLFGLPEGVVIQMNPSVSYSSDQEAATAGVKNDQCFALSQANIFGFPNGTIKIIPSQVQTFYHDRQAAQNGVPLGGLYAVNLLNNFGLTKGIIKKRIT